MLYNMCEIAIIRTTSHFALWPELYSHDEIGFHRSTQSRNEFAIKSLEAPTNLILYLTLRGFRNDAMIFDTSFLCRRPGLVFRFNSTNYY